MSSSSKAEPEWLSADVDEMLTPANVDQILPDFAKLKLEFGFPDDDVSPLLRMAAVTVLEELLESDVNFKTMIQILGLQELARTMTASDFQNEWRKDTLMHLCSFIPMSSALTKNATGKALRDTIRSSVLFEIEGHRSIEYQIKELPSIERSVEALTQIGKSLSIEGNEAEYAKQYNGLINEGLAQLFGKTKTMTAEQHSNVALINSVLWKHFQPILIKGKELMREQSLIAMYVLSMTKSTNPKVRALGFMIKGGNVRVIHSAHATIGLIKNGSPSGTLTTSDWYEAVAPDSSATTPRAELTLELGAMSSYSQKLARFTDIPAETDNNFNEAMKTDDALATFGVYVYHLALPFREFGAQLQRCFPMCPTIVEEGLYGEIKFTLVDVFVFLLSSQLIGQSSQTHLLTLADHIHAEKPALDIINLMPPAMQKLAANRFK